MAKLFSSYCDICQEKEVKSKVRTICDECLKIYDSSDSHSPQKATRNPTWINWDQVEDQNSFQGTLNSPDHAHFPPDVVKQSTSKQNTVLYRAQVAVDNKTCTQTVRTDQCQIPGSVDGKAWAEANKAERNRIISKPATGDELRVVKCSEFSIKRPEDTTDVVISGVLAMSHNVVVCDEINCTLKLFDHCGKFLDSVDSKSPVHGIAKLENDMFASCGSDQIVCVWILWESTRIVFREWHKFRHNFVGITYNGTYYAVRYASGNAISVFKKLDRHEKIRKFDIKEAFGRKIGLGPDIHMDSSTHNIYVLSNLYNDGVFCVSEKGNPLWFTPLYGEPRAINEINGILCVACWRGHNLHLIYTTGGYTKTLLDKHLVNKFEYLSYSQSVEKLFLAFYGKDTISVYLALT